MASPKRFLRSPPGARHLYRWRRVLYLLAFSIVVLGAFLAMSVPAAWEKGNVPPFFPDRVLYVAQLFAVETPDGLATPRTAAFQTFYLLAILLTFGTLLHLLSNSFSRLWAWIVVRIWFRRHRVICGLSRKGIHLARVFAARGDRVILIERDERHREIEVLRSKGFRVLVGDAASEETLDRAAIRRASSVFLVCLDEDNFQILRTIETMAKRSRGQFPVCHVHVWERALYEELQLHESNDRRELQARKSNPGGQNEGHPVEVHYHSVAALAGSRLLDWRPRNVPQDVPVRPLFSVDAIAGDHFVVVGVGAIGSEFVLQCARRWAVARAKKNLAAVPTFHLVDRRADEWKAELEAENPGLEPFWRLLACRMDIPGGAFSRGEWSLTGGSGGNPVPIPEPARILVALPTDTESVAAALAVLRQIAPLGWSSTLVVVRIAEESGVMWRGTLQRNDTEWRRQLQPFNQLKEVLSVNFARHAPPEQIAIALHTAYLRQLDSDNTEREAKGMPPFTLEEKPAGVVWELLAEQYRESTRQQAASIVFALRSLSEPCEVVMEDGSPQDEKDSLDDEEIWKLARREHDRWVTERRAQGWSHGEGGKSNKQHRDMVSWEDLSESSKKYDYTMVEAWPEALAASGLRIQRKRK